MQADEEPTEYVIAPVLSAQIGTTEISSPGRPYDSVEIAVKPDWVVAPIVTVSACASVTPTASVAVTVIAVGPPAAVGVPDMTPVDALIERPAGSVPDVTE